ncbi:MAG: hypothetical protein V7752_04325 [Halopseudomonas sp.]
MPRYLGSPDPDLILYLPNPPRLPASDQPINVPELIALNGNHWRKIFTILAKLSAGQTDWKSYRDNHLLKRKEAISFDDALIPSCAAQIVAGKANWMRLGLSTEDFCPLDESQQLWQQQNLFLTPYFDYRQFPNALVEQLKPYLVGQA